MSKVLKPYTIIPTELYVQRDADRQLKHIIDDMQRPGYVLVSRQMGKTNLLLNAKRKLETPDDVFVYVDLSNPYDSAKSCFENIIDTALETNSTKFDDAITTINNRRLELQGTPPHKQHTNELRILLGEIKGKLVIILDEIDALTKTKYSDQIFSQIRSIYFSRVNYPELERLTYILSGVVEPTEIIKDPKISPFNIGQKIFLNDFNKSEFHSFIQKASLELPAEITERIFFWTNGNPRMTWDVCAEVESEMLPNLTIQSVDKIVENTYLTTYDKPPIDNIRELVKNDREIRNSIVEIEFKKGKEISDKIKNKLYLAGIINYNYNDNDIHIKNEIIRRSLSLEWIRFLEEEDKGLVKLAIEFFEKQDFTESLRTFEKFLLDNEFEETDRSLCYYYMGYASYRNSNFDKAIEYLSKANFDSDESAKLYYRVINLKGLAFYYLDKMSESLECFKEVRNRNRKDELYARALLNFGSIALKSDQDSHKAEAINIFNSIIDETGFDNDKLKPESKQEIQSIAHYNLAQILSQNEQYDLAIENYYRAIELAKDNTKPSIVLPLLDVISDQEDRYRLLSDLIELITTNKIKPTEKDPDTPLNFTLNEFRQISILAYLHYPDNLFDKLKPQLSLLGEKSFEAHLYELALYSVNGGHWDDGLNILREIYKDKNFHQDAVIQYNTLKLLAYISPAPDGTQKAFEYISLFRIKRIEPIDFVDMEILANTIHRLRERGEYSKALDYVNLIISLRSEVSENLEINYLVIFHLELNIYYSLKKKSIALTKAKELLTFAMSDNIKQQKSNLLGETGLDIIKQNAESIIRVLSGNTALLKKAKNYGRNQIVRVRYKDGTILETKYKKIENDVRSGACFIIS